MHLSRIAISAVLLSAGLTFAEDAAAPSSPPPSSDEIKRVLDYQDNGKDRGPALLDLVACNKVDQAKGSATIFTCLEPITAPVKKGTLVNAWTQWFCPKGGKYEDVAIQWLFEGQVRSTSDLTVEGLARTRTWRAQTLSKAGKWTIKVLRGSTELGSTTVTVEN